MAVFAVLDQDPYEIPIENLKDIPVHGTVFGGEVLRSGS
jgi:predicted amidohydrolase YtcJ